MRKANKNMRGDVDYEDDDDGDYDDDDDAMVMVENTVVFFSRRSSLPMCIAPRVR